LRSETLEKIKDNGADKPEREGSTYSLHIPA